MLLELTPLAKVPRPDGVVESTSPQLCSVRRDVYAAGAVRVPLELSGTTGTRELIKIDY